MLLLWSESHFVVWKPPLEPQKSYLNEIRVVYYRYNSSRVSHQSIKRCLGDDWRFFGSRVTFVVGELLCDLEIPSRALKALRRTIWNRMVAYQCNSYWFPCQSRKYSWIGHPIGADERLICQRITRATMNPRPQMKSSRQGESRSFWYIFLWSFFDLLFLKTRKHMARTKYIPGRFGFASSNTCLPRSQTLWGPSDWWQINFLFS